MFAGFCSSMSEDLHCNTQKFIAWGCAIESFPAQWQMEDFTNEIVLYSRMMICELSVRMFAVRNEDVFSK